MKPPKKQMVLPAIAPDANKYTRGSLLVLGGSARFPGAGILAAWAGALAGAGYVTLATPQSAVAAAQAHLLSVPVIAADEKQGAFAASALSSILEQVNRVDAIVLGPGMTKAPEAASFARSVQTWAHKTSTPLLVDADALDAVVPKTVQSTARLQLVITPHEGELKRLFAATSTSTAEELAIRCGLIVVAKGSSTTTTDGMRTVLCEKGSPALAKAGTGDVLSGIIGALLAQGMEAFLAAEAGVSIHAQAGCIAEERYGTRSVMPEHLLETIPYAVRMIE